MSDENTDPFAEYEDLDDDVGLDVDDKVHGKTDQLEWFRGEKGRSYRVALLYFHPVEASAIKRARQAAKDKGETISREQGTTRLFHHRVQHATVERKVDVTSGDTNDALEVVVQDGGRIIGHLRDQEGEPRSESIVYLYRPVRPRGEGLRFYERFGKTLATTDRQVVIFSVADCLEPFLPAGISVLYADGHLTCYRWPGEFGGRGA